MLITYTAIIGGDHKVLALHRSAQAVLERLDTLPTWHTSLIEILASNWNDAYTTLMHMGYTK